MNIAIRNIHRTGITGFAFHGYVLELVKRGYISHLYFDEDPRKTKAFSALRKQYSWTELGLDRAKIITSEEELQRECDVLLNFDSLPEDFTPAIKRFSGLKIFHTMDYFWNEPLSEKVARLDEYGIDYVFAYGSPDRYCSYFQKHAPQYTGRVIPLPFGFGTRFVNKKPFAERKRKCVAVGSVRPLRFEQIDARNWREPADFHQAETWFHKFRRQLVVAQESLASIMDSMLPVFPRYRDYDYNMVEKLNEYQLFVSDESLFYFPSAKAFEGPATGAVMVCSSHPCFQDLGFIDGDTCLMHAEFSVEDFARVTTAALSDQSRLAQIAERGERFVHERYSHSAIAKKIALLLERLFAVKQGREQPFVVDEYVYGLYRNAVIADGSSLNEKLKAWVCVRQWWWYQVAGAMFLLRAECLHMFHRIWGLVNRVAVKIGTRVWKQIVTLLFDTHPIDVWRKRRFQARSTSVLGPLTDTEAQAIETLRADLTACAPTSAKVALDPPARKWRAFTDALRQQVMVHDPREFLAWEVIRTNMGYRANTRELRFLQKLPNWPRFAAALREPAVVNRVPFFAWPETSENTVRQAYHIAQFEATTGTSIDQFEVIVDFGGGYGSMTRFIQALGFKGTYIVFDWPEFLALQKFYLTLAGSLIPAIVHVSSLDELRAALVKAPAKARKLLIATWSLSEAPVSLRDEIFAHVRPDGCLLTYQRAFAGILNKPYFDGVIAARPDIDWRRYPMSYIPAEQNQYLMGVNHSL